MALREDILGDETPVAASRLSGHGAAGKLPLTPDMLRQEPSGNLFGLTQNVAMGWDPAEVTRDHYCIVSTQGGLRAPDGTPLALGYHTGHWEVGLLVERAASTLRANEAIPFAVYCHRSVRRAHPGHHRHVRQPALPQRRRHDDAPPDPLLADAQGRAGHRHLRQGPAGDHDGPGGQRRPAGPRRARRRDPARSRSRGRRDRADDRRALQPRPDRPGLRRRDGLQGVRLLRGRLPVFGHGGHGPGRRRGAGHGPRRTAPWPPPASRSGWTWPTARRWPCCNWQGTACVCGTS